MMFPIVWPSATPSRGSSSRQAGSFSSRATTVSGLPARILYAFPSILGLRQRSLLNAGRLRPSFILRPFVPGNVWRQRWKRAATPIGHTQCCVGFRGQKRKNGDTHPMPPRRNGEKRCHPPETVSPTRNGVTHRPLSRWRPSQGGCHRFSGTRVLPWGWFESAKRVACAELSAVQGRVRFTLRPKVTAIRSIGA